MVTLSERPRAVTASEEVKLSTTRQQPDLVHALTILTGPGERLWHAGLVFQQCGHGLLALSSRSVGKKPGCCL